MAARHYSRGKTNADRGRHGLDAGCDGRDALFARLNASDRGVRDGHRHRRISELTDAHRFGHRRIFVRRDCGSHRPDARADGVHPGLFAVERGVRVFRNVAAARGVSLRSRLGNGRGMDDRSGADRGDVARRASGQGARADAIGVRDWRSHRRTGCGHRAAAVRLARGLFRRRAAGVARVLDPAPRAGTCAMEGT